MKNLLRFEELSQFLVCLFALIAFDVPWWCYLLLVIGPDIGMLGYLVNERVGAITYNLLHHKGVPVLGMFIILPALHERYVMWSMEMGDFFSRTPWPIVLVIILYGHASMDRIFGYGLKFNDSFHHTHLGWIGKETRAMSNTLEQ